MPRQGATVVSTTDGARRVRRFPAGALAVAFGLAGCVLNPKTDDPNAQGTAAEPRGTGAASGNGGSSNFGGYPGQLPPPAPGAGGTVFGGTPDGGVGAAGGPITAPVADASAGDGGPGHTIDAGDAGDARPDRHAMPTRD